MPFVPPNEHCPVAGVRCRHVLVAQDTGGCAWPRWKTGRSRRKIGGTQFTLKGILHYGGWLPTSVSAFNCHCESPS